jgi:hypothetical protein
MKHDIRNSMMLAAVSVKMPAFNKQDKQASRELCERTGAEYGSARVNKSLFPKSMYASLKTIDGKARHFHSDNTLPWDDKGYRVLMVGNYSDWLLGISKLQDEFYIKVDEMTDRYEKFLAAPESVKREKLGSLYHEGEYPTIQEFKSRFSFTYEIMPMPSSQDFRVDIGNAEIARIQKQVDDRVSELAENAFREAFKTLHAEITDMAGKLQRKQDGEKNATIRDTLVPNLTKQLDILERMATGHDPDLMNMVREARFLVRVPSEVYKDQPTARTEAIKAAGDLASKLEAFL